MKKLLYPLTGLMAALTVLLFRIRRDSLWTSWLYHAKVSGRWFRPDLLLAAVTGHRLVCSAALLGGVLLCVLLVLFLGSPVSDRLFVRKLFPALGIGHLFTVSVLFLLAMLAVIITGTAGKAGEISELAGLESQIREEGEIIHAGGRVFDSEGTPYSYTNSLESVMNCVSQGISFVEIDLQLTSDGYPVCVHSWNALLDENGGASEESLTLDEFTKRKIMGIFTPMTLDDLAALMKESPGMYVIADIRGKLSPCLKSILTAYPGLRDRFIIQIYHEKQYETVYAMGFHRIIYTLYRTSEEEHSMDRLRQFSDRSVLLGITMRTALFYQEDLHDGLLSLGVPIFVHTIDNEDEKKQLLSDGAAALYTNISTQSGKTLG